MKVVKRKAKLTPTQKAVMGAPSSPNPGTAAREKRAKSHSNQKGPYSQGLQDLRHGKKDPA